MFHHRETTLMDLYFWKKREMGWKSKDKIQKTENNIQCITQILAKSI